MSNTIFLDRLNKKIEITKALFEEGFRGNIFWILADAEGVTSGSIEFSKVVDRDKTLELIHMLEELAKKHEAVFHLRSVGENAPTITAYEKEIVGCMNLIEEEKEWKKKR